MEWGANVEIKKKIGNVRESNPDAPIYNEDPSNTGVVQTEGWSTTGGEQTLLRGAACCSMRRLVVTSVDGLR